MANTNLSAESNDATLSGMRSSDAIVDAYVQAFELDPNGDADADSTEGQFAFAAQEGAAYRARVCGINSPRHAALAAILAFEELQHLRDGGLTTQQGGRDVIDFDFDFHESVNRAQDALGGIYDFLHQRGASDLTSVVRRKFLHERNHRFGRQV